MDFDGKNVLITGGAGFIGSTLAIRLVESGAMVTVIDSLIPTYGGNLHNIAPVRHLVRINISDVRDPYSMEYLVKGQDFLFNLAGQTSHLDSMTAPEIDLEINARSQLSILEACRHHNPGIRIVFASTRQIYGVPSYLPVDEAHPIKPVDVNGINKSAGEQYHLLYNTIYSIRSTVLRLTNTYGPRMRIRDARQTFLGIWIKNALTGQPFEVWGGDQLRDFNYIDDCVDALLAATADQAVGQIYNLGSREVISLARLAALITDIVPGSTFTIKEFPGENKKIDIGDYYADFGKITKELGWAPKVSLSDGISATCHYYRDCLDKFI